MILLQGGYAYCDACRIRMEPPVVRCPVCAKPAEPDAPSDLRDEYIRLLRADLDCRRNEAVSDGLDYDALIARLEFERAHPQLVPKDAAGEAAEEGEVDG